MEWKIGNNKVEILVGKQQEYENPNAEIEESILKEYAKNFEGEYTVEHKSSDYSTLVDADKSDIVRLKYGNKAKWIKIPISKTRNKYMNDPLFIEQKNKHELFWKSPINSIEDLSKYIDIIKEEIENLK